MVVLIVDDQATNLRLLRAILRHASHTVVEALTGTEAMACVNVLIVDAAIIDLRMPTISGPELARALRQLPSYKSRPLIAVSADLDEQARSEALRAGFDVCLDRSSPDHHGQLLLALGRLCPTSSTELE